MRALLSRLAVVFVVCALVGVTAGAALVANGRPLDGLVSWWAGDGSAADVMATNNGILVGGASYAPGVVGQAFSLHGPGDWVEVPNSPSLDITGAITMAGWFKSNTANGGMLMFKGDAEGTTTTSSYGIHIGNWDRTDGSVVVVLYGGYPSDRFESVAGLVRSDQCWYHVAATWDGTTTNPDNVRLYVNGVLVQSWTKKNPLNSTSESLTIGSMKLSPYHHAHDTDGRIDEVAVYARALSAAEIQAIYAAGSARRCSAGDSEPPIITTCARNRTLSAGADGYASIPDLTGLVIATDDVGVASISQSPLWGTLAGVGDTLVTLTAADAAGNSSSCEATVSVIDDTPPTIASVSASPASLWPPQHKMVPVTVAVSASDNGGATTCRITSVSSNEPVNGLGDGDTSPDWQILGNRTVLLRAERSGTGSGRTYTITVRCTDGSGNAAVGTASVNVPRDQGNK